jgi:PAS domain S-box-containing protein
MVNAAAVPIWVSRVGPHATWFNDEWLRFVGRALAEDDGLDWLDSVHPEDRDHCLAASVRALRTQQPYTIEYRLRRHDGIYRQMRDVARPYVDADGTFAGYVGTCTDITDERGTDEAAAYLAAIVASSDDAIISKDLNGIIRSCNASAERLFGYPAAELIGRPIRMLIPADRQHEEDDILARLRRGERIEHFETIRLRKDGHPVDLLLTVSPVRDADGRIIGVSKTARDITERKRTAAALLAQEARYRVTLSSIGDGVVAIDPLGRVQFMNATAEALTGWSAAEAIGQPVYDVVRLLHEQTRRPLDGPMAGIVQAGPVTGGRIQTLLAGRHGREPPISTTWSPIVGDDGQKVGSVLVLHDITEERRAEAAVAEQREWFRTTLESIGDAVIATDVQGRVVFMNPVAEHLTGWRMRDAIGQPCENIFRIVNESTRREVISPVRRVLSEGITVGLANHTILIARDGTERPIDDSGAPIRRSDGRMVGVVLVFRDVSERRRAESERQTAAVERERLLEAERVARSDAEKASRVKDDFVAMVSHELRTPLNAILGWTQLMAGARHDPDIIERGVDVIARNTRVQAQLIADLLDMSRIVSGKLQVDVQSADMAAIMRDAIDAVQREAELKGLTLTARIDGGLAPIAGDPARLQQIIWNLLSNAIKFTPAGGRIDVVLGRRNEHLELVVSDTGAGIAPEVLPHVFERFHQADRSITRRFGGLGLGLAIVRHLVELHGGTVRAESDGPGLGATFTVTFPVASPPSRPYGNPSVPAAAQSVTFDGLRVLVVEDEPDTRDFVARLLQAHGAVVTTVAGAAQALEAFRASQPDLLISDIGLPDVDGYDMIRQLRREAPRSQSKIPAIALTAYARSEDRTRALLAGFQGHLAKPVEATELIATVASFCGVDQNGDR